MAAAEVIGTVLCISGVLMLWRAVPQLTLVAAVMTALLMQVGVVQASSVPGVAQLADAKAAAERWSDDRVQVASCRYRFLAALSAADLAQLEWVDRDCANVGY